MKEYKLNIETKETDKIAAYKIVKNAIKHHANSCPCAIFNSNNGLFVEISCEDEELLNIIAPLKIAFGINDPIEVFEITKKFRIV